MLERAAYLMPCLEEAQVTLHLAGVRPHCTDGRPIIGRAPGWGNVFLATGHYSKGIRLGPITGKVIADLLLRGRSDVPVDVSAFSPARFARGG